MGDSQGPPGLLAGLGHPAGGQPGERRPRAVHPPPASPHCCQLLWVEAPPGGQRPDMDGPVPGAERAGSPPGGSGPTLGSGMLSHRGRLAAAHVRQLRPRGDELIGGDPLHHRERGIHSEALTRLANCTFYERVPGFSLISHVKKEPDASVNKRST